MFSGISNLNYAVMIRKKVTEANLLSASCFRSILETGGHEIPSRHYDPHPTAEVERQEAAENAAEIPCLQLVHIGS